MEICILIDTDNMRLLKVHEDDECLAYWADILIPQGNYTIRGTKGKDFSVFTQLELRLFYQSLTGAEPPENTEYGSLIRGLQIEIDKIEVDETSLDVLKEKLGRPLSEPDTGPKPWDEKETVQALKRPGADTATGKVWGFADQLMQEQGDIPDRKEVIKICEAKGIHPSTASTQYGKWKKFLQGSN